MKKREQEKEIETKNEEDLLFQVAKMGLMDELTLNAILNKFSGIVLGNLSFFFFVSIINTFFFFFTKKLT
jgi:hypothetical protein